jgi:hypothetical protein
MVAFELFARERLRSQRLGQRGSRQRDGDLDALIGICVAHTLGAGWGWALAA